MNSLLFGKSTLTWTIFVFIATIISSSTFTFAKPLPKPSSDLSLGPLVTFTRQTAGVPAGYVHQGPAKDEETVTLKIAVKSNDMNGLENALTKSSTPGSKDFGNHLTKEEVESYIKPSQESISTIASWLSEHSIPFTPNMFSSPAGDRISLTLPISKANQLLGTTFNRYIHGSTQKTILRTSAYSLPELVARDVEFIHPTTLLDPSSLLGIGSGTWNILPPFHIPILQPPAPQPPVSLSEAAVQNGSGTSGAGAPRGCKGATTPACLSALYGIPSVSTDVGGGNGGVSKFGMAVTGFIGQYANKRDFTKFLTKFRPDIPSSKSSQIMFDLKTLDGGKNDQEATSAGVEAALDVQYSLGMVAPNVNVSFISVGEQNKDGDLSGFLDVVEYLIGMSDSELPRVVSTSYGANEADLDPKVQRNLCNAIMQLTARGVTVLFSSGDGGVAGTAPGGQECKNFLPTFPSGCPYVTSVGSTHSFGPEVGSNFSSGGFSTVFKRPGWQKSAVKGYLAKLDGKKKYKEIKGRFNRTGRGFPDVAVRGEMYQVVVGGRVGSVDGTSASTPVFAAMIALLNSELEKAGKNSVGFLNPLIYGTGNRSAFNDVVGGRNPGCQTGGFGAEAGWDAVTGLGTPKYSELRKLVGLS